MKNSFIFEVFLFPDLKKNITKEIFVCLVLCDSFYVNSFVTYENL